MSLCHTRSIVFHWTPSLGLIKASFNTLSRPDEPVSVFPNCHAILFRPPGTATTQKLPGQFLLRMIKPESCISLTYWGSSPATAATRTMIGGWTDTLEHPHERLKAFLYALLTAKNINYKKKGTDQNLGAFNFFAIYPFLKATINSAYGIQRIADYWQCCHNMLHIRALKDSRRRG